MLFAYVCSHLANHALGLVSLEAAERGRVWFIAFWRSNPASIALYGGILVHVALALSALYARHTLRMPPIEAVRLILGFSMPFLLAQHIVNTRLAYELYGQADLYARVAWRLWVEDLALAQLGLMLVAWVHGCLGLHFAFRFRPIYRRLLFLLFAGATLLPTLAFLGFVAIAREIAARPEPSDTANTLNEEQWANLSSISGIVMLTTAALFALAVAARVNRAWREHRGGRMVALTYPDRVVRVPRGFSVLEASRAHAIAHLSLCGGRGRCSTCRIRVSGPPSSLPAMKEEERQTLSRIAAPPDVRLACQLRPLGDLSVAPMLSAGEAPAFDPYGSPYGVERDVVILFIDLRRWTGLAEDHLPFDLVYVLNKYFAAVGDAVHEAGGIPNQFIGDSVMAIFGLDTGVGTASRQALAAAAGVERRMAALNANLRQEFARQLDFGMGIHAGPAAIGSVGYRETRTLSAVGDAVNTASRLQELTKTYSVNLVISDRVALEAEVDPRSWSVHEVPIRGRATLTRVYAISSLSGA